MVRKTGGLSSSRESCALSDDSEPRSGRVGGRFHRPPSPRRQLPPRKARAFGACVPLDLFSEHGRRTYLKIPATLGWRNPSWTSVRQCQSNGQHPSELLPPNRSTHIISRQCMPGVEPTYAAGCHTVTIFATLWYGVICTRTAVLLHPIPKSERFPFRDSTRYPYLLFCILCFNRQCFYAFYAGFCVCLNIR